MIARDNGKKGDQKESGNYLWIPATLRELLGELEGDGGRDAGLRGCRRKLCTLITTRMDILELEILYFQPLLIWLGYFCITMTAVFLLLTIYNYIVKDVNKKRVFSGWFFAFLLISLVLLGHSSNYIPPKIKWCELYNDGIGDVLQCNLAEAKHQFEEFERYEKYFTDVDYTESDWIGINIGDVEPIIESLTKTSENAITHETLDGLSPPFVDYLICFDRHRRILLNAYCDGTVYVCLIEPDRIPFDAFFSWEYEVDYQQRRIKNSVINVKKLERPGSLDILLGQFCPGVLSSESELQYDTNRVLEYLSVSDGNQHHVDWAYFENNAGDSLNRNQFRVELVNLLNLVLEEGESMDFKEYLLYINEDESEQRSKSLTNYVWTTIYSGVWDE